MLKLHDVVRLKKDNKKYGIPAETIGAIIDVHGDGSAYTVEFVDGEGNTYEEALFTEFREDDLILVK
ncbi:MAG: DUF4926 domain-containing protein [Oscillospiraceae bacterium]|nr:DUF4926 domain-containing protein [Oscillospiraceae bacterium]